MSTINVTVTPVEILEHPQADRLEVAQIGGEGGFLCIVGKGQFKNGELALYLPPDSMLTEEIMDSLSKNKISMKDNRLRAMKIRGVVSEGLCLKPSEWLPQDKIYNGSDVTKDLGIKKYKPKVREKKPLNAAKGINPWYHNTNFPKYTGIERFEKRPRIFEDSDKVIVTLKYHGTNFRAGQVTISNSSLKFWQRIKRYLFGGPQREFLVGSRNTVRKPSKNKFVNLNDDLYWKIASQYRLEQKLFHTYPDKDIIIYGEVVGPNIQKGYDYGLESHKLLVFDVMMDGKYIPWESVKTVASLLELETVDPLYEGPWNLTLRSLAEKTDIHNNKKYVREGIVVKDAAEKPNRYFKRTIAKVINPEYLLDKTNSENQ
jgi:RNA ligase (TIGR02306 family)